LLKLQLGSRGSCGTRGLKLQKSSTFFWQGLSRLVQGAGLFIGGH
jgi:hypothetical protein